MSTSQSTPDITRRKWLQMAATGLGAALAVPQWLSGATNQPAPNLYSELLKTWCDGLLAHQVTAIHDPALYGGILCPACALIHGRCGDAVYPLLRMARSTGDSKYLEAALRAHQWSEQLSRSDGSWVNDVALSSWKGITVFHAIALAEALHHHGSLLETKTRRQWTDRLARAIKFLDGFITIDTGNINYPVTSTYCFALAAEVLQDSRYLKHARKLARISLDYFTPNGFLFGEGHPQTGLSAKHCRPADLGYNVEESLPALAMYAMLADDKPVLEHVISAMRSHMEFMLPDGGWDNSWGTRNYKWTWWGSRTSDGCQSAFVLLAQHDPRFNEAAWRNLELMVSCTHQGLLYGGPHNFEHGDLPCIHHTFSHAKALATVMDRGGTACQPAPRLSLPRDEEYGLKQFPEIGTSLASIGDWRATVTEYDWDYNHTTSKGPSGGHASGGALSLLYHRKLGPILTASMTEYQLREVSNQQVHGNYPQLTLTPRIEYSADRVYTSLSDFAAAVTSNSSSDFVTFEARGRLLTAKGESPASGDVHYRLVYRLSRLAVEILAVVDPAPASSMRFILPVVSPSQEAIDLSDPKAIRIFKNNGTLSVRTADGFDSPSQQRVFNLVPGLECLPLAVVMDANRPVRVELRAEAGF